VVRSWLLRRLRGDGPKLDHDDGASPTVSGAESVVRAASSALSSTSMPSPAASRTLRVRVQAVDLTRPNDHSYLVGFLENEQLTGEMAWLREIDLLLA
jgi:hypothetical protein